MSKRIYIKVLRSNHKSTPRDFSYKKYLPKGNSPGPWTPAEIPIVCVSGWHVTDLAHLKKWVSRGTRYFVAEGRGRSVSQENRDKWAFKSIRLLGEILFPDSRRVWLHNLATVRSLGNSAEEKLVKIMVKWIHQNPDTDAADELAEFLSKISSDTRFGTPALRRKMRGLQRTDRLTNRQIEKYIRPTCEAMIKKAKAKK